MQGVLLGSEPPLRVCKVSGSILSTHGGKRVHYYAGENELSESPKLTVREVGSKEEAMEDPSYRKQAGRRAHRRSLGPTEHSHGIFI